MVVHHTLEDPIQKSVSYLDDHTSECEADARQRLGEERYREAKKRMNMCRED
jgi:hypothetical protein